MQVVRFERGTSTFYMQQMAHQPSAQHGIDMIGAAQPKRSEVASCFK
jgi:hypothetical protein